MKTRSALGLFLLALTGAWAVDALLLQPASGAAWPWALRQQALYLTGVWSIGLMSLIMLLALRPAWLEGPWAAWTRSTGCTNGPASWPSARARRIG
ncbi:hypothetical protein WJ972_18225 [Achromobacter insuavis]